MTHGKQGSSTRAHTHTDTHTLSSCKPLDAPSSPLSKSKLFWVFAEGTASFLWAWESTGMPGRPKKRTFRPKPRLRNREKIGINRHWGDARQNIHGFRYDNKPFEEVSCKAEKRRRNGLSPPLPLLKEAAASPCRTTTLRIQQLSSNLWP